MSKSSDEQLAKWVEGESVHNHERDECCPDFSCCKPDNLAPAHERKAFAAADDETRTMMLGGFLSRAIATYKPKTKVHVAGIGPTEEVEQ